MPMVITKYGHEPFDNRSSGDVAMRYLPDAHTEYVFTLDIPSYAIVAALALIAGIARRIWFR